MIPRRRGRWVASPCRFQVRSVSSQGVCRYTLGMDLGFESVGNACLIAHDRGPVLACDPWITGAAYFGSWRLAHEIPTQQIEHVKQCRYLWISHGHPDHLSLPSLEMLRDKQILVPDHYGGRIACDLRGLGFAVTVMKCGEWLELSPRLRVASIANFNQDAVLLIDLDGHLLIDANDAGDRGASRFFRREMSRFRKKTFITCLTGYGDADMIHFYDEQGHQVLPNAAKKEPVGPKIAGLLGHYGIQYFVPSSSNHCYRRTDSAWANEYATPVSAHGAGFISDQHVCLPPYVSFDLAADRYFGLNPTPTSPALDLPEVFGDDWSTPLERADLEGLRAYFGRFAHLPTFLGHLNFRVGGKDHVLDVNREHRRGITFRVPLDDTEAARMLNVQTRNYRRVLGELLRMGKIKRHDDGYGNDRIETERRKAEAHSKSAPETSESADREADQGPQREDHAASLNNDKSDITANYSRSNAVITAVADEKGQSFLRATKDFDLGLKEKEPPFIPQPQKPKCDPDGVQLVHGRITLDAGNRAFWLDAFGGDGQRLDLALIQAAAYVQPNSSRALAAQVGAQLARSAAEKRDRDKRYRDAAATNKLRATGTVEHKFVPRPVRRGPEPGSPEYIEMIAREMGV